MDQYFAFCLPDAPLNFEKVEWVIWDNLRRKVLFPIQVHINYTYFFSSQKSKPFTYSQIISTHSHTRFYQSSALNYTFFYKYYKNMY